MLMICSLLINKGLKLKVLNNFLVLFFNMKDVGSAKKKWFNFLFLGEISNKGARNFWYARL